MVNKKIKIPPVGGGKSIPPPKTGSTQQQRPFFSLEFLGGKYCLSHCDDGEKAAFADTLHKLSKLTWAEIKHAHKHGCGSEIIPRESLNAGLPPHVTDEVNVLAFRFKGKAAMVGYRDDRVFYVLFLDRDFTLYRHS